MLQEEQHAVLGGSHAGLGGKLLSGLIRWQAGVESGVGPELVQSGSRVNSVISWRAGVGERGS